MLKNFPAVFNPPAHRSPVDDKVLHVRAIMKEMQEKGAGVGATFVHVLDGERQLKHPEQGWVRRTPMDAMVISAATQDGISLVCPSRGEADFVLVGDENRRFVLPVLAVEDVYRCQWVEQIRTSAIFLFSQDSDLPFFGGACPERSFCRTITAGDGMSEAGDILPGCCHSPHLP